MRSRGSEGDHGTGTGTGTRERGGLSIVALPFVLVAVVGLAGALYAAYLLMRGPFFDGPRLESVAVLYAAGGFVLGIVVMMWGGVRAARIGL